MADMIGTMMGNAMEIGQKIGGASGAASASVAEFMAKQSVLSKIRHNEKVKQSLLENGVGFNYDTEKSEWQIPDYIANSDEARLGMHQYLEKMQKSYRNSLEDAVRKGNFVNQIWGNIASAESKSKNPAIVKGHLQNLEDLYRKFLPQEMSENLNIVEKWQTVQKVRDVQKEVRFSIIQPALEKYRNSRKLDDLHWYQQIYAEDPDFFKDHAYPNPDELEKTWISEERQKADLEGDRIKKQMEVGIQMGKEKEMERFKEGRSGEIVKRFEMVTGIDPSKRGTREYQEQYMKFIGEEKKRETGSLTENQVAHSLQELAMSNIPEGSTIQKEYAKYYNQFRELVAAGLPREDALNEVLQGKKAPVATTSGKKTYKHIWD